MTLQLTTFPSPARSPYLTQLAVGAAAIAVIAGAGLRSESLQRGLIAVALLGVIGVICLYDARTLVAPNRLVYPGILFALAAAFTLGPTAGFEAFSGGLLCFAVMLLVALAGGGRMGMGDVKMGALCGAAVGIGAVLPTLVLTFILGGLFAAAMLISRRRSRTDSVAFTPFLGIAVLLTICASWSYIF